MRLALGALLFAVTMPAAVAEDVIWPGEEWASAAPAEVRMDAKRLDAARD